MQKNFFLIDLGASKDGALDEDDFTRAFNDVPTVQVCVWITIVEFLTVKQYHTE